MCCAATHLGQQELHPQQLVRAADSSCCAQSCGCVKQQLFCCQACGSGGCGCRP